MKLEEGKAYFTISYCSDECPIPEIESYVFVGTNVLRDEREKYGVEYYFQMPASYIEDGPIAQANKQTRSKIARADLILVGQDLVKTFLNFDDLILRLKELIDREKDSPYF